MVSFVSPGVYVIEKDNSNYPTSINPSVVGIVGFASQGPVNKPTLVTSQENLLTLFGDSSEDIPGQALEGSLEILEATNSLYFVRAAEDSAAEASAGISVGAAPAVAFVDNDYGVDNDLFLSVQVTVNGVNVYANPKEYDIPAGTLIGDSSTQAAALKKIVGGSVDGSPVAVHYDDTTLTTGYLTAGYAGSSVLLGVSAWSNPERTATENAFAPVQVDGATSGTTTAALANWPGITIESPDKATGFGYLVESLYPGAGYNLGTKSDGNTSGFSFEVGRIGGITNTVQVNRNGFSVESYKGSFVAAGAFWEEVINTATDNAKSQYIKANFLSGGVEVDIGFLDTFIGQLDDLGLNTANINGFGGELVAPAPVNPRFLKFVEGTYGLAGGDNGIPALATDQNSTIIGTAADKTGIYALDDDTLNISMGLVPGLNSDTVQNALIALAEESQNFLAVVAPPEGLDTPQQAIDWSNGQSDERTSAITSNFAAVYWPWVQIFDVFSSKDRWYDPAIFAVRQMAVTDDVADPWFAPAGVIRGRLTKPTDVEVSVNQGDRDSMYSGGNIINPIVNFPQQGIMIFGQRTAQRTGSALDRVNVRRLMIIIRKLVLAASRRYVFEPNDATTWEKVEKTIEFLLDEIKRRRGLIDYKVVCDETTNTPIRVDRNELWATVILKPTKAAEVVVIELDLRSQAADI